MITFTEWMKWAEAEIAKGGWSKKTTVSTGMAKDHNPGHPTSAKDPEKNPAKHRGKIHHHTGGHENAPGHPKNAVDPSRGKKK